MENIVIAILAKDKGHVLPTYLNCIYNQTYPKSFINLYIRTNDNKDDTEIVLRDFIDKYGDEYASVFFDSSDVSSELKQYGQHEWNVRRFHILGKIRQDSIDYAISTNSHYFVIDCDNFITPDTLMNMYKLRDLQVISPMLISKTAYSNYHYEIDVNGYLQDHQMYYDILNRTVKGCIDVKVVHCTYFINNSVLDKISYNDNSNRYEYVIFSDILRNHNIKQYLDNRFDYGFIVFSENSQEFESDFCNFKSVYPNIIYKS